MSDETITVRPDGTWRCPCGEVQAIPPGVDDVVADAIARVRGVPVAPDQTVYALTCSRCGEQHMVERV